MFNIKRLIKVDSENGEPVNSDNTANLSALGKQMVGRSLSFREVIQIFRMPESSTFGKVEKMLTKRGFTFTNQDMLVKSSLPTTRFGKLGGCGTAMSCS